LVLIGFEKFGHLDRTECCECISEHLIPIRQSNEISRKLADILKSEEKKEKFMVSYRIYFFFPKKNKIFFSKGPPL
jgi:hypothetical protein